MTRSNILVIGSGGREHALVWALAKSVQVGHIYTAPGNAGTEKWPIIADGQTAHCTEDKSITDPLLVSNVPIQSDNIPGLLAYALEHRIDLTVVGPESSLAGGIVDEFHKAGLRIFGPTRAAAQLETSKSFAKAFMRKHSIPTADYAVFTDYDKARFFLHSSQCFAHTNGLVVKADGLAGGKGVIVCDSIADAELALKRILVDREFGSAGDTVLIEEKLEGPELSVLAFSDGHTVTLMPSARDHKRINDDDQGPNTGGMGAIAPVISMQDDLMVRVRHDVLEPTIAGMFASGTSYVGVLYAGLMLTDHGPKVLEFNCRFGDPETQSILPLLDQATQRSADYSDVPGATLLDILMACADGQLHTIAPHIHWRDAVCATVVLAALGYPGPYRKGLPITGLEQTMHDDTSVVFHAGTYRDDGRIVTSGGRVLSVSATGSDLNEALKETYQRIASIHFDGMHYRKDIGRDRH